MRKLNVALLVVLGVLLVLIGLTLFMSTEKRSDEPQKIAERVIVEKEVPVDAKKTAETATDEQKAAMPVLDEPVGEDRAEAAPPPEEREAEEEESATDGRAADTSRVADDDATSNSEKIPPKKKVREKRPISSKPSVRSSEKSKGSGELAKLRDGDVFGDGFGTSEKRSKNAAERSKKSGRVAKREAKQQMAERREQEIARQMKEWAKRTGEKKLAEMRRDSVRAESPSPATDPDPVLETELDGFENRTLTDEMVVSKPMTETAIDPMSTFSIDVDTGAYTLARARLREGYRPKPEDVRIEEFLNYFHYDYPEPADGSFAVHLEAAPDPFASGDSRQLIRIGVKGKGVPEEERPPAHLTFLVDVSGSMFGRDKLDLAREALEMVTRNLRPDDTIALVTYASDAEVRLWPAGASERDIISRTIGTLEAGGSSALDEGLELAYEVASTHFRAGHINRVVVMGDGRANVGETRPRALLQSVQSAVEDGVVLSTIGFGAKAFNDATMERLADNGNGNYFFVDSYREVQKVFGYRLCGTLHTIAKDVKIQVEFNPESVLRHRLIGYENRRLEHREFRDDAVDAGEIGAGHAVTAIYAVELTEEPDETIATVRIRHKLPDSSAATETDYHLWAEEVHADIRRASPDFKFAAAVALFAEVLKGDEPGDRDRMSLIREIASEGLEADDEQPDRREFVALVDEATPYFVN